MGYSLHQVVHECLQRDVISEDGLRRHTTTISARGVCGRRIQLRQQETGLRATGVTDDEPGQRETVGNEFLGKLLAGERRPACIRTRLEQSYPSILFGLLQERLQILVPLLVLIAGLAPFGNRLAVENKDVEESVEKEDVRGLN